MIEVMYVNSNNQSVSFFGDKIKVSEGSFHKRKWTISQDEIKKDSITYSITLTLRGSLEERKNKLNELHDIFEIDLINEKTGKLYFGEYYIECYIQSGDTQINKILNSRTDNILEVYCPNQSWIKETTFSFFKYDKSVLADDENKTYPYQYSYKYGNNPGSSSLVSDSLSDSNFKLIIYGPSSNPSIMIGNHMYNVNVDLNIGEYLTVDSINREVYITDINGNVSNAFDYRNKDNYLFEKISPGLNNVEWSAGFGFDAIIYDERSEPKWI